MKQRLDLDFSSKCRPFNPLVLWGIAAALCLLLALILQQSQVMKTAIAAREAADGRLSETTAPRLSEAEIHSLQLAHETQKSLNIPWQPMLAALEKAQAANPEMRLLTVQPNPSKGEININGVVSNFNILAQYIEALKAQPEFGDAILTNQHWNEAPVGQEKLGFTLTVEWKRHG
jgi:hypothetical protein